MTVTMMHWHYIIVLLNTAAVSPPEIHPQNVFMPTTWRLQTLNVTVIEKVFYETATNNIMLYFRYIMW